MGEAKTAAGASKLRDLLADTAKVLDKLEDGAKTMDKLGDGAKVLDKLEDGSKTINKIKKAKEAAGTVKQAGKGTGKLNQVKRYKNNLGEYKNNLTKKISQAAEELSGKPGDTLQDIRNGLNRMMGESQPAYAGGSIDKAGDASRAETWYHKSNVMKSEGNTGGSVHIGGPKWYDESGLPIKRTIDDKTLKELKKLGLDKKFIKANQIGFATRRQGTSGIIKLSENEILKHGGKQYTYKIKVTKASNHLRVYGYIDKQGELIFDYIPKNMR